MARVRQALGKIKGGLKRARRPVLFVLAGIGAAVVAAVILLVGGALGVLWTFSRGDARATVTLPSDKGGPPIVLDIQGARLAQEMQKQATAGLVEATVDLYAGPFNIKVVSLNLSARIPLAALLGGGLPGGPPPVGLPFGGPGRPPSPGGPPPTTMGAAGQEGAIAGMLFGPLADRTLPDALSSVPAGELARVLGPDYRAILPQLYADDRVKTLAQVFAQDPQGFLQRVKQTMPRAQIEGMVQQSFPPFASMTSNDIQGLLPPDQIRAVLGDDYQAFLTRLSGGDPRKTLATAIADDPARLLELMTRLQDAAQRGALPTPLR